MGINISAKLMVGKKYGDMSELLDEDEMFWVDDALDNGVLDYASPYYDSPRSEWWVGYELEPEDIQEHLEKLKDEFIFEFGITPEIVVTPDVN